ncbi:MAG: nucleotidyltransferase family protein [Gemmatimonadota bacterium]|nr:nucleotidyltransferase family protein [Gemmatimonadota bacterium]
MSLASLSPEAQLLLLTAGGEKNDPAIKALLARPLDWAKLSWLAEQERATPVLWRRVSASAALPEEAQTLHRMAMVSEFRMSHLETRLLSALGTLEAAGTEVVLLKGAALALTVYGSFVARPMSDVDLLVSRDDALRARDALLQAGWVSGAAQESEFYEGHHHLPPIVDGLGTGTSLELHTSLFFEGHPFRLTSDDIRARAELVTVGGRTALVPSVHDQLLHLCLHFAWSHMMATGAWRAFRDLDALLRTERVEWKSFTKLARDSRGGSACYWTFRLARTLSGIAVPAWVERALAPPDPEFALRRLEQHFTYDLLPTENISPSLWLTYTMWRAGLRPQWSGHGRVRPWDRADELLQPQRPPLGKRLMLHIRNAKSWSRYARLVLLGP